MKNKGGGNKSKKQGRKNYRKKTLSLDDLTKDIGQEYGFVQEKFGDGRYKVMCYDKVLRMGIVRGSIKNSCRIQKGSLVLVSLRDFEEMKCDILYEYLPDDIDKLQVDMLELVRKALIINPNDIDRQAYAKLTTQVSFDNKDDLKVLLRKLVENHYPDLELGGIEPGPGV